MGRTGSRVTLMMTTSALSKRDLELKLKICIKKKTFGDAVVLGGMREASLAARCGDKLIFLCCSLREHLQYVHIWFRKYKICDSVYMSLLAKAYKRAISIWQWREEKKATPRSNETNWIVDVIWIYGGGSWLCMPREECVVGVFGGWWRTCNFAYFIQSVFLGRVTLMYVCGEQLHTHTFQQKWTFCKLFGGCWKGWCVGVSNISEI